MLQAIRSKVSTWVVRLFLLLLVLSFAVWGIGDMFLGTPGGNVAAEVGGQPVTLSEVSREYTNNLRDLQQRYGAAIDREGPLGAQILNDSLARRVGRKLIEVHASDLDIDTDDETVADAIREIPAFQVAGQFSRANFEFALQNLGLTEPSFVEEFRSDLTRERILEAFDTTLLVPDDLGIALEKHREEERVATILELPYASVEIAEPESGVLESFLETNADSYFAPEYRTGAILVLSPEIIAADLDVAEEEVVALYEERRDQLGIPARRNVQQIVTSTQEAIELAKQEAVDGVSFSQLPNELSEHDLNFTTFDDLAPGDLPATLDSAIWETPVGEVSQPVESDFGWHIFSIESETPATETPLEDVRSELTNEIGLEKAIDLLPDLAAALDDEIAAGQTLEEAAQNLDLQHLELGPLDSTGQDESGERTILPTIRPEMLQAFFAAPIEEISLLEETADGAYYVYRVDQSEPERPYRLDEIRERVQSDWRNEQQRAKALEEMEARRQHIGEVTTLEDLHASTSGMTIREAGPLKRDATSSADLSAEAIETIFQLPEDGITEEVVELLDGVAIIRVDSIDVPLVSEPDPELATELSLEFRNDLLAQYEQALRRRYPVSINQAGLSAILQPNVP
ncbi:MAG: SurA N-terminal domain-containing protein [Pseudomonadota bacterium]